jgi:hypothetical protein
MHPALFKLYLLSNQAALRRMLRGARTFRGALMLLVGFGGVVLWVGISVLSLFFVMKEPAAAQYVGSARPYLSMILLGFFLSFVWRFADLIVINFSPAEVEFLFSGPFHRRELLLFKLMKMGLVLIVLALFIASSPMLVFFGSWLSAFVGIVLTLMMMRLVGLAIMLAKQIVAQSVYTKTSKAILMAVMVLVATGLPQTISRAPVRNVAGLAQSFRTSWPGRVLLAPFEVFSQVICADRLFPDLIGWGMAAAAIDLGLLLIILKLDVDYTEREALVSQARYELMQRLRRTGGFVVAAPNRAARLRVSQLPWLGGAGPIAWRQLLLINRTSRSALVSALMLSAMMVGMTVYASWQSASPVYPFRATFGIIGYVTMIFVVFPWSFRGDIDHLDILKTLPVQPMALAVGELGGGVLMLTAVQLAILAMSWPIDPIGVSTSAAVIVFAVPVNLLLFAANNLVFLLFPVRSTGSTVPDFQFVGRVILAGLLRMLILVPGLCIPASLGGLAYLATGLVWPSVLTALLLLAAELPPLVMLVSWAFQRFDPSTDMPAA